MFKQVVGKTSAVVVNGGSDPTFTINVNFISQHGYASTDVAIGMEYVVQYFNETVVFNIDAVTIVSGSNIDLTLTKKTSVGIAQALLFFPSTDGFIQNPTTNFNLVLADANISSNDFKSVFNHNMIILDNLAQRENRVTIIQTAHGFDLTVAPHNVNGFIPLYFNRVSGLYEAANTSDMDQVHSTYLVEVVDANTFVIQNSGVLRYAHGLTVGHQYWLQDDGTMTTAPDSDDGAGTDINELVAFIPSAGHIFLVELRPVIEPDPSAGAITADLVNLNPNIDVDGDGTNETNVQTAITNLASQHLIARHNIVTVTGTYAVNNTSDYTVLLNDSNGNAILPSTATTGQIFKVKLITTPGTARITTAGSQTIDGLSQYDFTGQYQVVSVQFDGTNYHII